MDLSKLLALVVSGVAGLFGSFALSVFWLPAQVAEKSAFMRGVIIGGVGVSMSTVFSGVVMRTLGYSSGDLDYLMPVGFLLGASALSGVNLLANTFKKRKEADLFDVAREARGAAPAPVDSIDVPTKEV